MADFLYLLREVYSGFKIGQQNASRYAHSKCTLKTSYDLKTLPCSSHRKQVLRAEDKLRATTAWENNDTPPG